MSAIGPVLDPREPLDGGPRLLTVGHGTLPADDFADLLQGAGVTSVVDIRTAPGSKRHPQFRRQEMERWLPAAGIGYRWEPLLGGWRKPSPESLNTALRNPSFRGYADYMETPPFSRALAGVVDETGRADAAVMCSESLWWRCHRRLVADAAVPRKAVPVLHLMHDGRLGGHVLTSGVRLVGGSLRYDGGQASLL